MENLLETALRLIPHKHVKFRYRNFIGSSVSDVGIVVQNYTGWKRCKGIVEPGVISSFGGKNISEREYHDLGMDFSRRTCTLWCSRIRLSTGIDKNSPDQIEWNGNVYNVINCAEWDEYDGWIRAYCQEVVDGQ